MTLWPTEEDWHEVKRRALKTAGFNKIKNEPDEVWKKKILTARHSPIRYLRFSFDITCPSWVATHLCRHTHAQPYIQSQRNDRQSNYDRNAARQDAPVNMIWDINGEEIMVIANKRLCNQASKETQEVVIEMCRQIVEKCPEYKGLLVPTCGYTVYCPEMKPCGKPTIDF